MNRWSVLFSAVFVTAFGFAGNTAEAQVFFAYGAPAPAFASPAPVIVAPSAVVTTTYAYPAPVVAAYAPPVVVAPTPVVSARVYSPVVVAPAPVQVTVRSGPYNFSETVRTYGPGYGPHYSRMHVHYGPNGVTFRERIR